MVSNQSITLTTGCQSNINSDTLTTSGQIKSPWRLKIIGEKIE